MHFFFLDAVSISVFNVLKQKQGGFLSAGTIITIIFICEFFVHGPFLVGIFSKISGFLGSAEILRN